ncbi:MAG TPA: LutB/LldF family L-lactate oxidation iron-sulfur protein [Blastocatellia bacterium]|nr:LutB/LldF family L-lactate oxidation iron-sulfur protein [Blastocatellia bacterium]
MTHLKSENFTANADAAVADVALQNRLRVLNNFTLRRAAAFAELPDGDALRDRARQVKAHTIHHLDRYLVQLEENVKALGGHVHWARTGDEACAIILDIARRNRVRSVVKSKSMATEEIHLNAALAREGVEAVETDLGEYIVQLADEPPSHILAPAIHKSKADIADLFGEKLNAANLHEAEEIAAVARRMLRERFRSAEMGVTGANFAVAETGTVVLLENEGNIRLSTSLPRLHVAVVGIEKLVPRFADLSVFLKILARSATGQTMSSYVSFITGTRRAGEVDGADEFHLVLLDNGRTRILTDEAKRESLYCLRCGACLNVCPVYQKIGGHAYGSVYPGPIGSIITPPLMGLEKSKDLPFASSLCGACREVCPVRINIPHVLLSLRGDWSEGKGGRRSRAPLAERLAIKAWAFAMKHPRLYDWSFRLPAKLQGPLLKDGKFERLPLAASNWTRNRDFPAIAPKPFRALWREMNKR